MLTNTCNKLSVVDYCTHLQIYVRTTKCTCKQPPSDNSHACVVTLP